MTVLFYDGFDIYNVASIQTYDLITPIIRYGVTGSWFNYFTYASGFDNNGNSIVFNNNTSTDNSLRLPLATPLTSFSIGAHIFPTYGITAGVDIFTIRSADGVNFIRLTTVSNNPNSLNLIVNGSPNTLTFVDPLDQNTWQHIELQAYITSANMITVNLYIAGTLASSWSGSGFNNMPYSWTTFYIGKSGGNGSGGYRIDNLYVTDGEHLGVVEVKTLIPSADTGQKDGIAINGVDNYSKVNEFSTPMIPKYVAFTDESTSDVYELANPGIISDDYDIIGAQALAVMIQSPTMTQVNGYVGLSSSMVDSNSVPVILDQTTYKLIAGPILVNDPATATTWTVSGIDDLRLIVGRAAD